jgi:LysM repeat protein
VFASYRRRRLGLVACLAIAVCGGQQLAQASSGPHPARRYTVQPGDSLWLIAARRYGGDPRSGVAAIEGANSLATDVMQPGQVLVLP